MKMPPRNFFRLRWRHAVAALAAVCAAEAAILTLKWPYLRDAITEGLERSTSSRVKIEKFDLTFLPYPGCVAEKVHFSRGEASIARVTRLTFEGSWLALVTFQHRLKTLRADGLHIRLPRDIPPPVHLHEKKDTQTTVGELTAHGAVVELGETRFEFPRVALQNVSPGQVIRWDVAARMPNPPGLLEVKGSFGPWNSTDRSRTPASGAFVFREGDLSRYGRVRGTLAVRGTASGTLAALTVRGESDIPDFEVNRTGNPIRLQTMFDAVVNALNVDVQIRQLEARFLRSALQVTGQVRDAESSRGKVAELEFISRSARIEDLLTVFTKADPPALYGPVALTARVRVPHGEQRFLRRLHMRGQFQIERAAFGKARTQVKVNELSSRARESDGDDEEEGSPPSKVTSRLAGAVALRDGVARLSDLTFEVPGAIARGEGSYNVITKRVDLRGTVAMQATLSEASSGIKSVILKPFDFLFRKKHAAAVLPVSLTGFYPNPQFRVSLKQ
jgi:hypothetical protein